LRRRTFLDSKKHKIPISDGSPVGEIMPIPKVTRPQGATLEEINRAVGHHAWSYINDTKRLAQRCGGIPHWDGDGARRRFWISLLQLGSSAANQETNSIQSDHGEPFKDIQSGTDVSQKTERASPIAVAEPGGFAMSDFLDRIRGELKSDRYYQENFSNEGQKFLAWYLRNCYLRTQVQARDDITDGQNDKEIDAVIIDEDKRQVIIIQSKFFAGTVGCYQSGGYG
jgi:hypothetical protein